MVQKATKARERFEAAALALFQDRGYARTTVLDIAARAGLTERTFFRYFRDKPEVLFWRADHLRSVISRAIASVPTDVKPSTTMCCALSVAGVFFDLHREDILVRKAIILSDENLQAREMIKNEALEKDFHASLKARNLSDIEARVMSKVGLLILQTGYETWATDGSETFARQIESASTQIEKVLWRIYER